MSQVRSPQAGFGVDLNNFWQGCPSPSPLACSSLLGNLQFSSFAFLPPLRHVNL